MLTKKINLLSAIFIIFFIQSCVTKPPENPDNICLIFEEKRSWYKAAMRSEKEMEDTTICLDVLCLSGIKL